MAALVRTLRDSLTIARYRLSHQSRRRAWMANVFTSGFFMVGPLVLLGETIVGSNGERLDPFFANTGYINYTGYLAVPLVFAFLTNSSYSWIGQAIRSEQVEGTLERTLISMKHPSALILGGVAAHVSFLIVFIAVGIASISLLVDLNLNINWATAALAAALHLYAVYGFAFILSSLFLWIRDAFAVQQAVTYVVIPVLAGAGFPVSIFPGWLEFISRLIPFTWAFELERKAFLQHASIDNVASDAALLFGIATFLWVVAYFFFRTTLRRAKKPGSLGMY